MLLSFIVFLPYFAFLPYLEGPYSQINFRFELVDFDYIYSSCYFAPLIHVFGIPLKFRCDIVPYFVTPHVL
jgi:hypothetical protein